jgi:lysophospholipase L1-like esterase
VSTAWPELWPIATDPKLPMTSRLLLLLACLLPLAAAAQGPSPAVVARWGDSLAAFERSDRQAPPAAGGVLFVGSSSIRLWTRLPEDFRQVTVINRGFGGSTMADCSLLARQLVVQYRPRHVFVYAGDNDLAEGRTPQQVLESFRAFVQTVRTELPDTRISYIAVKPSPDRERLLTKARETNELLAAYVAQLPNASFVDVFTPMLDGDGRPRTDLYGPDRLHMNAAGYALWRQLVTTHIVATTAAPEPVLTPAPR